MPRILCAVFLSLYALASVAQVYRHVDENGNVTFTDRPPPDAERVQLQETNTSAPPPVIPRPEPAKPAPEAGPGSYTARITAPAHETIIPNGPGNFSVSASIDPALGSGDLLQLKMDGSPQGEPQAGSSWALTNIFRGEHHITIAVVNKDGKELAISEPVTVFVFRPSTNNRNRRN